MPGLDWQVVDLGDHYRSDTGPALALANVNGAPTFCCAHKGASGDNQLWCTTATYPFQSWSQDQVMRVGGSGTNFPVTSGPALCAYHGAVYCAYREPQRGGILIIQSTDAVGWSEPSWIPWTATAAEPAVAVTGDGTRLVCAYRAGQSEQLYVTWSADGTRWSPAAPMGTAASPSGPAIAFWANAMWCVYRDDSSWLHYTSSPDLVTWSAPQRFPQHQSAARPALTVAPATLCCAHRGAGDNGIWLTEWNGTTWSPDAPSTDDVPDACNGITATSYLGQLWIMYVKYWPIKGQTSDPYCMQTLVLADRQP